MKPEERWVTENKEFGIYVSDKAWKTIREACNQAKVRETGGILIGYYAEQETMAIITQASTPATDSKAGMTWFHRGVGGLEALLKRCWSQTRRTYYLGEWHYHPASHIEPSIQDLSQMRGIRKTQNFWCQEPILIIVGKSLNDEMNARAWVFPDDESYLEFIQSDAIENGEYKSQI